jgi:hypothetical protein
MTTAKVLADRFRKLAEDIRRVVPEQDLKVLAREVDLVLPAHAGQLMCDALDSGFFQPEAVWDHRKYSPKYVPSDGETIETVVTRLQREYVALCSQFSDARERGLCKLNFEEIQESTQPSAQRKNLLHQMAYAASWWAFIRELWRSEPLQFRPDADRHFLFLDVFLALNRGDESSEPESFYSLHKEKPTRVRHRLVGSAEFQAAACEVVAKQIEEIVDGDSPPADARSDNGLTESTPKANQNDPGGDVTIDDQLPLKLRRVAPSRQKARAVYEWAMSKIPNSEHMTISELYDEIECHPSTASEALPPSAKSFGKYLTDAGIKRNQTRKDKGKIPRENDI